MLKPVSTSYLKCPIRRVPQRLPSAPSQMPRCPRARPSAKKKGFLVSLFHCLPDGFHVHKNGRLWRCQLLSASEHICTAQILWSSEDLCSGRHVHWLRPGLQLQGHVCIMQSLERGSYFRLKPNNAAPCTIWSTHLSRLPPVLGGGN